MSRDYKIVYQGGVGEIEEKKSRFIANVFAVETEEEAAGHIEEIKRKYWDARHNCYAYRIGEQDVCRSSDDGEPSGTAGRPILEVLTGEGLHNALVVVTRYFGGTLLGTGGLVRAYSQAAKEGIAASKMARMYHGMEIKLCMDYNYVGKVQYLLADRDVVVEGTDYGAQVTMELLVPKEEFDRLQRDVQDVGNGQVSQDIKEGVRYAAAEGKVIYKSYGLV